MRSLIPCFIHNLNFESRGMFAYCVVPVLVGFYSSLLSCVFSLISCFILVWNFESRGNVRMLCCLSARWILIDCFFPRCVLGLLVSFIC